MKQATGTLFSVQQHTLHGVCGEEYDKSREAADNEIAVNASEGRGLLVRSQVLGGLESVGVATGIWYRRCMSSSPQQRYEVKGISSSSSEETVVVESVGKEHKVRPDHLCAPSARWLKRGSKSGSQNSLTWGVDGKEKIESKSEELSFRQKLKVGA